MTKLFLLLAFYFSSNCLKAQCLSGNCKSGTGIYRSADGSRYHGQFINGRFHGKGKYIFSNKDSYEGTFSSGKKHGVGQYNFIEGHTYIGNFHNDKRQGKGKMTFVDGSIYKGDWINDKAHGNGIFEYQDGTVYNGSFEFGKPTGDGKYVLQSKDKNESEQFYKVEKTHNTENATIDLSNYAFMKLQDCTNQYCDAKNGLYLYGDGATYYGEFQKGKPEGKGVCTYLNGDVYEGAWKDHGPNGKGTMIKSDGKAYSGNWSHGSLSERDHKEEALAIVRKAKIENKLKPREQKDAVEIYAVVVGVATYSHMPSLKYTDDDAYQLYAFLKSPEGGALTDQNISLLIDDAATSKNIMKEIGKVFARADANDVVMIYMSGHGLEGNFVPVDYDGLNNLLPYSSILSVINASEANQKVMVTDACHSGNNFAMRGKDSYGINEFYQKLENSKGGTAIISSCKANEVSLEYSGLRQGIFSHYLIRGLKGDANADHNNMISVQELFNYVYTNVRHYTNNGQTPGISGKYDANMPIALVRDL